MRLTDNFTLEELAITSNSALKEENLRLAQNYLGTLRSVAELLERVRAYLGAPIIVHSGYRCPALNGATVGSSKVSQHMKGEAVDWSCPAKFDLTDKGNRSLFDAVKDFLTSRDLRFGQLIDEGAERPYGNVVWMHLSLGAPWREAAKCGQLLRMRAGKYENLGAVPQP